MVTYSRLSSADREAIHKGIATNKGCNEIAREIGRSSSTVSREIRKQKLPAHCYSPVLAQIRSHKQQSARKAGKRKIKGFLAAFVDLCLLEKRFSPEQISHHLKMRFPSGKIMQVCHEAIYQYIYHQPDHQKRRRLIEHLRRRKKHRRRRKRENEKRGTIPNMVSIHERSEAANKREEIGHWEGDLVIGKDHGSAILTLVDRFSRFTMIEHLGTSLTSETAVNACQRRLSFLPQELRKSLTYDRGKEMSLHQTLTALIGIQVYFADPHSPWQRGTNENTNGLIREFFPKGTDFSKHSEEEVRKVETLLNMRPRKILGFATPHEIMNVQMRKFSMDSVR